MAQAEGVEATNKAIKNITGVQNVGSSAGYSEGMINEDGSINANTDARL
jgi:hypothetical protein